MFDWLTDRSGCPVDPATRDWIDRRWAWLEDPFGRDRLLRTRVILPEPEDFPDPFAGSPEDARVMLDRVCGYLGIDPGTVELSVYEDRNPVHGGQWRQGTAGLYHAEAGRFLVGVEASNLDDPLGLVGTLAHELGHVLLLGHGRISDEEEDHEPLTDLLTVFLGFGVFTANSAIREQSWQMGAVAGWSVGRRGYLTMAMFGYALARFARARGEERPAWERHLRPDVRTPFRGAVRFLAADPTPALPPAPAAPVVPEGPPPEPTTGDWGVDADGEDGDIDPDREDRHTATPYERLRAAFERLQRAVAVAFTVALVGLLGVMAGGLLGGILGRIDLGVITGGVALAGLAVWKIAQNWGDRG
jgi:hypothetical protein